AACSKVGRVKNCVVQSDILPCHTKALPHWPSVPKRAGRPSILQVNVPASCPAETAEECILQRVGVVTTVLCFIHPKMKGYYHRFGILHYDREETVQPSSSSNTCNCMQSARRCSACPITGTLPKRITRSRSKSRPSPSLDTGSGLVRP